MEQDPNQNENASQEEGVLRRDPIVTTVRKDKEKKKAATKTGEPYLPVELIGGSIPYIPGTETEAVWNAATYALGTERVSFTYTIYDSRCWYLAVPTSALASHPESWCPLAAALPGNSEYWDRQTVYIYEQDGVAAAIRWDTETGKMQVITGASRTILPRVQSMDANFISIDENKAKRVDWVNRALNQERLARLMTRVLVFSGVLVVLASLAYWGFANMMMALIEPDLSVAKNKVQIETVKLITEASTALKSESRTHVMNVQQLLDELKAIGGTLVRYEVFKDGKAEWEALVPKAVNASQIGRFKANPEGLDNDGRMRVKGRI